MPQRDINEIRTEKIAVRCDTVEEYRAILALTDEEGFGLEMLLKNYQDGMCLSYDSISESGPLKVGYSKEEWHKSEGYIIVPASEYLNTIHPASYYLQAETPITETTTPAKYSAEEIKLMDTFAQDVMKQRIIDSSYTAEFIAKVAYIQALAMLTERNRILTEKI